MPDKVFIQSAYVETRADLPEELIPGCKYYIKDEGVVLINHGDGKAVEYGGKDAPRDGYLYGIRNSAWEVFPEDIIQEQINNLSNSSLLTSADISDIRDYIKELKIKVFNLEAIVNNGLVSRLSDSGGKLYYNNMPVGSSSVEDRYSVTVNEDIIDRGNISMPHNVDSKKPMAIYVNGTFLHKGYTLSENEFPTRDTINIGNLQLGDSVDIYYFRTV